MTVRILAVSDTIDQRIYSSSLAERMPGVQLAVSCGDLPGRYLEFIVDSLNVPLYYVLGNHAEEIQRGPSGHPEGPLGAVDISGRVVLDPKTGLIFAGLPGSPKYNDCEPEQYTEFEMSWKMLKMAPRLYWNKLRYGRALDVLITHAPPRDLGDREDEAHRGFTAIRKFIDRFKPAYLLHGHIHLYDRSKSPVICHGDTTIINVYPYQALELSVSVAEGVRGALDGTFETEPNRAQVDTAQPARTPADSFSPLRVEGYGRAMGQAAAFTASSAVTARK